MRSKAQIEAFFVGWDVGGWNCDNNPHSRDAIVILDSDLAIVGSPWRGNLREHINETGTTDDWIGKLFSLCEVTPPGASSQITMAIDTPLGFSEELVQLAGGLHHAEPVGQSKTNRYLFRCTERYLFAHGMAPLSAVKDMIGSQATKGMHVLAKFAPRIEDCGVWTGVDHFHAIETYPAACKNSLTIRDIKRDRSPLKSEDLEDARTCALVAYIFASDRSLLEPPSADVPIREGWIWLPRDIYGTHQYMQVKT